MNPATDTTQKNETTPRDLAIADRVTLQAVAEAVGVTPSAVHRWAKVGLPVVTNGRERLKTRRIGIRVYTTWAWVDAFLDACNAGPPEVIREPAPPRPAGRIRPHRDADLACRERGV